MQKLEDDSEDGESRPLHEDALRAMRDEMQSLCTLHASGIDTEDWNVQEIEETLNALHPQLLSGDARSTLKACTTTEQMSEFLQGLIVAFYERKTQQFELLAVSQAERVITLRSIDTHWMDHIDDMSHLREQVAFAGFAQRDPLIEYKDQGFRKFEQLLATIDSTIVRTLLQVDFAQFAPQVVLQQAQEGVESLQTNEEDIQRELTETSAGSNTENPAIVGSQQSQQQPAQRTTQKVGRNDPCPCGSGKKYKKCHGQFA